MVSEMTMFQIDDNRADATPTHKFNSTELLLLAHDEWLRREKRKHNDDYFITPEQLQLLIGWLSHKRYDDCDVDSLLEAIYKNTTEMKWVSGFINGFCTDKKWAREYVDKLHEKEDNSES